MEKINQLKPKKTKANKRDLLFYCLLIGLPVLQFCIFYIGVNFNSILMSFKDISMDESTGEWITKFNFVNYKNAFKWFGGPYFKEYFSASIKSFFITTGIGLPLALLFAYYIFKKLPGWGAFRVILYLPQILSGLVMATVFHDFISKCLPYIFTDVGDLLGSTSSYRFAILMFFNIWVSFGVNVLMYSNKMAGISEEIIESAHLDGATGLKEFWYIVLPLTYSTITVFLITGIAGICINQYYVYDMFGGGNESVVKGLKGIGYWFFVDVAGKYNTDNAAASLSYYSAIGVLLTIFTVPITLVIRWALEKYGPSEE